MSTSGKKETAKPGEVGAVSKTTPISNLIGKPDSRTAAWIRKARTLAVCIINGAAAALYAGLAVQALGGLRHG